METARKVLRFNKRGYALLITVVFVAIALSLLAGLFSWTGGASLQTAENNLFHESTGAADAATELTMAYMWRDFNNQAFGSPSTYSGYLPNESAWPVQFDFGDGNGNANQTGVTTQPLNWTTNWMALNAFSPQYSGLYAFVAQCTATSTATTANRPYRVAATVRQQFELAGIPIFQFAVFYNMNMEIDPGANLTMNGPVFSNDGIWAAGLATYNSAVSAVGIVATNSNDPFMTGKSDSTTATFNQAVTTNVDSLILPIGGTGGTNSVRTLLGLPPTGVSPYSSVGEDYFANEANVVVSNSPGGQLKAYYQDPNNATALTAIPYDAGTNNYSFVTNISFYDYRESKTVQTVQVNVGAFNNWLSPSGGGLGYNNQMKLHSGHYINSIYVYNNAPMTASTLPGVRVANGATLPTQGLTVVTPDPLYVLGNYNASGTSLNNGTNVSGTAPAALIGDAITVLSPSWSDSAYDSGTAVGNRTPTPTTVNAAAFEGIVPSNGNNYSGGVENFLRLLENWNNSVPLTYNGSIVVMFPSQYATNYWGNNNYYSPAVRNWGFDLNFMTQNGIPPLTPQVQAMIRQNWAAY